MKTIIPDVTALIDQINEHLDNMLELTGGESGRDFTGRERVAWDKLIKARSQLGLVAEQQAEDTKDLSRQVYMVTDPQSGVPCRYMSGDLLSEARGMLRIHEDDKDLDPDGRIDLVNRDALEQEVCALLDGDRFDGSWASFRKELGEILDRLEVTG